MHRQTKKEIPRYMMHICKETTAISYFELRLRYEYCNIMGTSSCLETCMQKIQKRFLQMAKAPDFKIELCLYVHLFK